MSKPGQIQTKFIYLGRPEGFKIWTFYCCFSCSFQTLYFEAGVSGNMTSSHYDSRLGKTNYSLCTCLWREPSHLLHEEVVHAAVVVCGGQDVQRVVLPLGGFQGDAADLHTATPPHLRRRLLVLLTVPDHPRGGCLQVWTVRRRRAFCYEAGRERVDSYKM